MTEITTLIAEARAFADNGNGLNWQGRIRELADAFEATVKEMHARELHHFEEEQARAEAEAERDRYRAALEETQGALDNFGAHTARVQSAKRIIARALDENGDE